METKNFNPSFVYPPSASSAGRAETFPCAPDGSTVTGGDEQRSRASIFYNESIEWILNWLYQRERSLYPTPALQHNGSSRLLDMSALLEKTNGGGGGSGGSGGSGSGGSGSGASGRDGFETVSSGSNGSSESLRSALATLSDDWSRCSTGSEALLAFLRYERRRCRDASVPIYSWRSPSMKASFALYDYQFFSVILALHRLRNPYCDSRSLFLNLSPGLGKTLIVLATIDAAYRRERGPVLVVCPSSVLYAWCCDVHKFFGDGKFPMIVFHRDFLGDQFDTLTRAQLWDAKLVLTTYDTVRVVYKVLGVRQWRSERSSVSSAARAGLHGSVLSDSEKSGMGTVGSASKRDTCSHSPASNGEKRCNRFTHAPGRAMAPVANNCPSAISMSAAQKRLAQATLRRALKRGLKPNFVGASGGRVNGQAGESGDEDFLDPGACSQRRGTGWKGSGEDDSATYFYTRPPRNVFCERRKTKASASSADRFFDSSSYIYTQAGQFGDDGVFADRSRKDYKYVRDVEHGEVQVDNPPENDQFGCTDDGVNDDNGNCRDEQVGGILKRRIKRRSFRPEAEDWEGGLDQNGRKPYSESADFQQPPPPPSSSFLSQSTPKRLFSECSEGGEICSTQMMMNQLEKSTKGDFDTGDFRTFQPKGTEPATKVPRKRGRPRKRVSPADYGEVEEKHLIADAALGKRLLFGSFRWSLVVFDESQLASNPNTQRFEACCALPRAASICLSGTPLRNDMEELTSQLTGFMSIDRSFSAASFGASSTAAEEPFSSATDASSSPTNVSFSRQVTFCGAEVPQRWISMLAKMFLTVSYDLAGVRMPALDQDVVFVDLVPEQRALYDLFSGRLRRRFSTPHEPYIRVLADLIRMRQVAIAPTLVPSKTILDVLSYANEAVVCDETRDGGGGGGGGGGAGALNFVDGSNVFAPLDFGEPKELPEEAQNCQPNFSFELAQVNCDSFAGNGCSDAGSRGSVGEDGERGTAANTVAAESIVEHFFGACAEKCASKTTAADGGEPRLLINDHAAIETWWRDSRGTSGMRAPKVAAALSLVKQTISRSGDAKIVVYSMFAKLLRLFAQCLDSERLEHVIVLGEDGTIDRRKAFDAFRTQKGVRVCLMTYPVGSVGLTLTEACETIFFEPWYSYSCHLQALFRLWRIGQTRPVRAHWLISRNTIEEQIMHVCIGKLAMMNGVLSNVSGPTITATTAAAATSTASPETTSTALFSKNPLSPAHFDRHAQRLGANGADNLSNFLGVPARGMIDIFSKIESANLKHALETNSHHHHNFINDSEDFYYYNDEDDDDDNDKDNENENEEAVDKGEGFERSTRERADAHSGNILVENGGKRQKERKENRFNACSHAAVGDTSAGDAAKDKLRPLCESTARSFASGDDREAAAETAKVLRGIPTLSRTALSRILSV